MKYDDDELAEAAVFLAHAGSKAEMPSSLEEKILAQGRGVASEIRFTTTKGAALTVEDIANEAAPRRSNVHAWVGWLAAAACFAFAIYEWRSHSVAPTPSAVAASNDGGIGIVDGNGGRVGFLRRGRDAEAWELTIDRLAANAETDHYRVWVSASDASQAVPLGSFACTGDCVRRSFALEAAGNGKAIKRIWITRNARSEETRALAAMPIVAEGKLEVP